ncbi:YceI family protein [Shewanella aestuarii]|uniref:YceI family protein n=1 Tax=Shewanella aestuarii TaxID=1028752 RepID=A0A6G9QPX0_9GAMM|nr:YceI family protein [Shewanella aestuarii]QIR16153.1 YceI family protein [Shewanella aestuarii]
MKKWLSVLALAILSNAVMASDWQVNNDQSIISFISVKKENIAEIHRFNNVDGKLTESGTFSLIIDLSSVNSGIEIRDERMQSLLFEVAQFPKLTLKAAVNPKLLESLVIGEMLTTQVDGEIELHGQKVTKTFDVVVAQLSADKMLVTSLKPVIVQAQEFGLVAGVEKLRDIAGLSSISLAVPVSFVVTLTK